MRGAVVVLATAAIVVALAPPASAAYVPEPMGPTDWVPNGGVHAVLAAGDHVYVGGSFTGGIAAIDATSGKLAWLGSANGDVRALALAPNGRLLLGGAFTTVGGTTHRKLAAVNAGTGAVDNAFRPAVGGTVRDIVVEGTTAYFGGQFTKHNGIAQGGLGAVDAVTGKAVTAFTASANSQVYSLGSGGGRLFIGGKFTAVNGQPRNYLASVTLSTNALDAWAPAMACSGCNVIWDLTVDPTRSRVYTAGRNGGGLNIVDMNTGGKIYTLGGFNGDTQALTLAPDGRLYVGGHFVTVGGAPRELVAEFDVSGPNGTRPVLKEFSANFVTVWPGVWAMASTSTRLYVGGDFTVAGTQTKKYPYFAMFPSGSTPPADATAPTVTATSPGADATDMSASTAVTATFSEPVQGVDDKTFTLRQTGSSTTVTASVAYNATSSVATLTPAAPLNAGAQYTATLTGGAAAIRDTANNPLTTTSWNFSTAAATGGDTSPPTVTVTSPGADATGVSASTAVTATFSEPVQGVDDKTFTLQQTGSSTTVTASVAYDAASGVATLTPATPLNAGAQYTATLTGGAAAIRDTANNPLTTTSWNFTTAAATSGDTTPPTVTHHTPWANAKGISLTANITATFSEEVTNVTTETFFLTPTAGGANVTAAVRYNATSGRWVLDPSAPLLANTSYKVTITNGVTDVATPPNAFAGYSWTFTTGA